MLLILPSIILNFTYHLERLARSSAHTLDQFRARVSKRNNVANNAARMSAKSSVTTFISRKRDRVCCLEPVSSRSVLPDKPATFSSASMLSFLLRANYRMGVTLRWVYTLYRGSLLVLTCIPIFEPGDVSTSTSFSSASSSSSPASILPPTALVAAVASEITARLNRKVTFSWPAQREMVPIPHQNK